MASTRICNGRLNSVQALWGSRVISQITVDHLSISQSGIVFLGVCKPCFQAILVAHYCHIGQILSGLSLVTNKGSNLLQSDGNSDFFFFDFVHSY